MRRPPHSLLTALFVTTVGVTLALGLFGWRLFNQQRAIDEQRVREQLEGGADALASDVRGRLAESGDRLGAWLSSPSAAAPIIEGAVVVALGASQIGRPAPHKDILIAPPDSLPFVPVTVDGLGATNPAFADIEAAEFGANRLVDVAERYRALARSSDSAIRAGALLRLARVLRKLRDFRSALTAYEQLAALGDVWTDHLPVELAGLDGQRLTLQAMADREGEQRVTAALLKDLDSGRWPVARGTAEFYRDEITHGAKPDSWQLADALSDLWHEHDGQVPSRGQRVFAEDGRHVLVLWRSGGARVAALAAFVETFFSWPPPGTLAWRLVDPDGHTLAGTAAAPRLLVTRIIGNADDPWTLNVWTASAPNAAARSRRAILIAIVAAVAFLWGATYFMARAIRREAEVARLQSDFVAAVSHEFRSPLTTVRQMAEMLDMDRVLTDERRHTYYRVVAAEAGRLQRLVETLLNFGRMESGAVGYRFVNLDAAALVREVVREIEPQARERDVQIEMGASADVPVRADESALSVAVRNLIDNAIKYSPRPSAVNVGCQQEHGHVVISVADKGPGIPRAERQAIFRKFVRGRSAVEANVKGTGVGLSIVQQIVIAHGGNIRLDSELGRGSTFTIVLPARGGSA